VLHGKPLRKEQRDSSLKKNKKSTNEVSAQKVKDQQMSTTVTKELPS
jgi:hypothetical protein